MFLFTHVFFFISSFLKGCKEYPFYQFFLKYIFGQFCKNLSQNILIFDSFDKTKPRHFVKTYPRYSRTTKSGGKAVREGGDGGQGLG